MELWQPILRGICVCVCVCARACTPWAVGNISACFHFFWSQLDFSLIYYRTQAFIINTHPYVHLTWIE